MTTGENSHRKASPTVVLLAVLAVAVIGFGAWFVAHTQAEDKAKKEQRDRLSVVHDNACTYIANNHLDDPTGTCADQIANVPPTTVKDKPICYYTVTIPPGMENDWYCRLARSGEHTPGL